MNDRYIKEGMMGFHESKGKYNNPYKSGSNAYNDFDRGWTQALKRASNQLLNKYKLLTGVNSPIP